MSSFGGGSTMIRGGSGGLDVSQSGDGHSMTQEEDQGGYLTPLQRSLIHELTTRRDFIAAAKVRADFWEKRQDQLDINSGLDDVELDELLKTRRDELNRLKELKQIKEAILQA